MNQRWYELRVELVKKALKGKLTNQQAATKLVCSDRSIRRYKVRFLKHGPASLVDHRRSNYRKLTATQIKKVKQMKREGAHRSCRHIRDQLGLPVSKQTVWRILTKAGLMHLNTKRLKPLKRFVAVYPNDLWQSDIMGKIKFPYLGYVYLIASIDDHSRFILSANWYQRATKQNVFFIWYSALRHWGVPKAMLQDRGSQYKATTRIGQADYQYYAQILGIKLTWAQKAQTKGKLERLFRFVQQDFVRENLGVKTTQELNLRWRKWVAWYNYTWKGQALNLKGRTPFQAYSPAQRKVSRREIEHLLVVEERRRVTRDSTISLYGRIYRVPPGYIGCRIWVKIKGNKLYFEADGRTFWKQRLKP